MSTGEADGSAPLLTLRVSRDGGRTWGPRRTYRPTDRLVPLTTGIWPPCRCPRCAHGAHDAHDTNGMHGTDDAHSPDDAHDTR
ncbi:hypothetical protein MW084_11440 [Streptomyces sudanensis]|uniref:Exo-alpha-sialidase n=1 Tax=Streptomyces sudanensis TaxID=436397 RepID=A0ABY4TBW2_9ACTN|nr:MULTISPECIES: hypothetical protein [Streptomyces]URN16449.1 hypothetical protein MW084_11440 [Streptomyces sudanensis]